MNFKRTETVMTSKVNIATQHNLNGVFNTFITEQVNFEKITKQIRYVRLLIEINQLSTQTRTYSEARHL